MHYRLHGTGVVGNAVSLESSLNRPREFPSQHKIPKAYKTIHLLYSVCIGNSKMAGLESLEVSC